MPPRILHVAQPVVGGVAQAVLELAMDQAGRGWGVEVATPPDPRLDEAIAKLGAAHHAWPATRQPGTSSLAESVRLRNIMESARPDVVQLHSSKAGLAGRLVLRGRTPTIFQPHGWSFAAVDGPLQTASVQWERVAARWAHRVLCVSEGERRWGEEQGVRASYVVIENGVDLSRFVPASPDDAAASRAQLNLGSGPVVACIGRLSHQKGQDLLLAAWPHIRAVVPNATLVLIGDGPNHDALSALNTPGVVFPGWARDPLPWLWAADVVALPSRWEGMAFVVLEAMAAGCSIVATDVCGMREALGSEAEAGGALVLPEDVPGLAGAISQRLQDADLRRAEGRRSRARAAAFFDVRRFHQRVADLTLSLLNSA